MESTKLPYDKSSRASILAYAERLLGKTLREMLGEDLLQTYSGKGRFGQLIEEAYFQYGPNSEGEPDFPEAGLELKSTPLKQTAKGLRSKERLVLNIINYLTEHELTFDTSSFWKKNACLLLMFYIHQEDVPDIDLLFKIIRIWEYPPEDLKIIKDDWQVIVGKIREGRAHELSESDTLYLGACTKGGKDTAPRKQPGPTLAKQRAFSLKSKYMNYIIAQSLGTSIDTTEAEPIVKSVATYSEHETFEQHIIRKFEIYYGLSADEIARRFRIDTSAKSKMHLLAKAILGVKGRVIEEFEKADVEMKTIRQEYGGALKESMSFANIKYEEIINEEWDDSYLSQVIRRRFLFIIFQKDVEGVLRLKKVMFWGMPTSDQEVAKEFWEDTKTKVAHDDFKHFIKISDDRIFHVRPKGKDASDLMLTATGGREKKMCYWLNSSYIRSIIG